MASTLQGCFGVACHFNARVHSCILTLRWATLDLTVKDRARLDNLTLGPDSLRHRTLGSDRFMFLLFVFDSIQEFIVIKQTI